jgi:hypothetical protein
MNRENIAGLLAGIIGLLVIAFAFFYGPLGTKNQPPKQTKIEAPPKAPEAPVRGPAVSLRNTFAMAGSLNCWFSKPQACPPHLFEQPYRLHYPIKADGRSSRASPDIAS